MTDQPSITSTIRDRRTTFVVTLDVTDAPHTPKPYTEQVIRPARVRLDWDCAEGRPELLSVRISGPRILKDGRNGDLTSVEIWDPADLPAWVVELAAQYRGQVLR